jgi:hypothetical protein
VGEAGSRVCLKARARAAQARGWDGPADRESSRCRLSKPRECSAQGRGTPVPISGRIGHRGSESRRLLDQRAAAGVAYTAERIEQVADAATHYVTSGQSKPGHKLVAPVVDVAYFEYANLLAWIRTLQDRLRSDEPRAGKGG